MLECEATDFWGIRRRCLDWQWNYVRATYQVHFQHVRVSKIHQNEDVRRQKSRHGQIGSDRLCASGTFLFEIWNWTLIESSPVPSMILSFLPLITLALLSLCRAPRHRALRQFSYSATLIRPMPDEHCLSPISHASAVAAPAYFNADSGYVHTYCWYSAPQSYYSPKPSASCRYPRALSSSYRRVYYSYPAYSYAWTTSAHSHSLPLIYTSTSSLSTWIMPYRVQEHTSLGVRPRLSSSRGSMARLMLSPSDSRAS